MELTGYSYPLQIDPITSSLKLSTGTEYIAEQIRAYIETEITELLAYPEYGLPDYLFTAPVDIGFITKKINTDLPKYIPQGSFSSQGTISEDGLVIEIFWAYEGEDQEPLKFNIE